MTTTQKLIKIPKNFRTVKEGVWQQPVFKNYLMKCCDCGLIHAMDFRIAYGKKRAEDRVQLKAQRIDCIDYNSNKTKHLTISVVRLKGQWVVEFGFDNQRFTLAYGGTKSEATWYARMLRKCFNSYTASIKNDNTKTN